MKPDPPIDSIEWNKKYSLKDRTPQVLIILFLISLLVIIWGFFKCKEGCDEKMLDSSKGNREKHYAQH